MKKEKNELRIEFMGCCLALLCMLCMSSPALGGEGDPSPNWPKAGREIKEAAKAVGEASKESWELAKEKGKEAWRETKETTAEAVQKTKKKIHDATAPKTSPQEAGPPAPDEPVPAPESGLKEPEPGGMVPEPPAQQPPAPEPAPEENYQSGDNGKRAI